MSTVDVVTRLAYLAAAACFVIGLHLMNSPATARKGNRVSLAGMVVAVVAALVALVDAGTVPATAWIVAAAGIAVGTVAGLVSGRRVRMTAMPQLVSLFNAVGGGAAALIGIRELLRFADEGSPPVATAVAVALDVVIGAVALSGSLIASAKLQGVITGAPVRLPGGRAIAVSLALATVAGAVLLIVGSAPVAAIIVLTVGALGFGVGMVLPIGGADMPVVISLLNAGTGTAVAMAGFVLDSTALIVSGALVGASGAILTKLMADAMNRSVPAIIAGGFGTADSTGTAGVAGPGGAAGAGVREVSVEDAAIQLAYASSVVIVPGFGLAAARAGRAVRDLADTLTAQGVRVTFAIHPVAGRMPGHMNVLLAEADVSYDLMREPAEANPEFPHTDVALVVGANDVTNPAARRPGNPISGMPILDVDRAAHVIVIKRSLGHGYAGLDNELYSDPRTGMLFADARTGLTALTAAVSTVVG